MSISRGAVTACALVLAACSVAEPMAPDAADIASREGGSRCAADLDCNDGVFCNGEERCAPAAAGADELGCIDGPQPCTEVCDETARRCVAPCPATRDADGDGFESTACGGDDCDDSDPRVHPGAIELCDTANLDEDCDPLTFGARDADGDGWLDADCCNIDTLGMMHCGSDCNDAVAAIHPSESDICNGLDDDCDTRVEEDVPSLEYRQDCDGDGHADPAGTPVVGCAPPSTTPTSCTGPRAGWSSTADDCDDGDDARFPGAMEICDGVDNDCDGALDGPGEDDDGDGYADACAGARATDCDDTCATCYPGGPTPSMCDGRDHDCDGSIDEGTLNRWYRDMDADGVGTGAVRRACAMPAGFVASSGDCNDGDAFTRTCASPLSCVSARSTTACGCQVTLLHGRDALDLDTGRVVRTTDSSRDATPEWAGDPTSPPIPYRIRVATGTLNQHLPFRMLSSITPADATSLTTALIDDRFSPDRVILVQTTAGNLFALGLPEHVTTPSDQLRVVFRPISPTPSGFTCP